MGEPSRRQNDLKSLPARAYLRVSTTRGTWSRQHPRLLYQERIDLVQRSRRELARARLRANRTAATNNAVRTAEPVCIAPQRLVPPAGVRGRLERSGLINANKRRWNMMCAGAAPPSVHSRNAHSGTCVSARASDTYIYTGTSQHTPAGVLPRRTDDHQTNTGRDTLNCARASARARRGGTYSHGRTSAQRCGATASASRQSANEQRP
jgi:hypothetical protein